jgi:hypothetical protein
MMTDKRENVGALHALSRLVDIEASYPRPAHLSWHDHLLWVDGME